MRTRCLSTSKRTRRRARKVARSKKAASPEARERAKDKRLQSKYGITLARQNELRVNQNDQCKICLVLFTQENPPCTDHLHFKIIARRTEARALIAIRAKWQAWIYNEAGHVLFNRYARTKTAAIAAVRNSAKEWSVRGLLCRRCNRGLGYIERFFDAARRPEHLVPVIEYFKSRLTSSAN